MLLTLSGAEYVYSRIASFHGRCPFIVIEIRAATGGRAGDALDCQWEAGGEDPLDLSHQRSQSASGMKGLNKAAHKELQQLA